MAHTGGHPGQGNGGTQGVVDTSTLGHFGYFHVGYAELLLFSNLFTASIGEMVGACIVVYLIAILFEGIRLFVAWQQVYLNKHLKTASCGRIWMLGALLTLSYMVHLLVGYCLMLVFMLMNVWLCLSVLFGAGTGFLLFHFPPVKTRVFRLLTRGDNTDAEADDTQMSSYGESVSVGGGCHGLSVNVANMDDGVTNLGYQQLEDRHKVNNNGKARGREQT